MNVECDNCQKVYSIAEDKIPVGGGRIKCTNCQSIIFVRKPVFSGSKPSSSGSQPTSSDNKHLFSNGESAFSANKSFGEVKEVKKETAESEANCPKCGSSNIMGDECLSCGIFISKYVKIQKRFEGEEQG